MKVLIITYYWPPAGGSGVQRWLKFVKYLQNFDIEPIVYTVDDASYPKEDSSLMNEVPENIEVLKQPIWEPTDLLFWLLSSPLPLDGLSFPVIRILRLIESATLGFFPPFVASLASS